MMKLFANTIILDFAIFLKNARKYIIMMCARIFLIASQTIVQRDTPEFLSTFRNAGIVDTMNNAPTNICIK